MGNLDWLIGSSSPLSLLSYLPNTTTTSPVPHPHFSQVAKVAEASMVKVVPTQNNGSTELVPIKTNRVSPEPSPCACPCACACACICVCLQGNSKYLLC